MIEELLSWLQLISQAVQASRVVVSQSQSNLVFIAYIVTMRKSYLFGAAFLLSDVVTMVELIPHELNEPLFGLSFYCSMLAVWLSIAGVHIRNTTNRNTLLCCAIMLLFLLYMAWDSYFNAYIETLAWRYYENIIAVLHAAIILSLYRPRFIFTGLVGKLASIRNIFRLNVTQLYFWYTGKNFNQGKLNE